MMVSYREKYLYDGQDRRILRQIDGEGDGLYERSEGYVYDEQSGNLLAVLDDQHQVQQRYLMGLAADEVLAQEDAATGQVQWLLADHQGSVRQVLEVLPAEGGLRINHLSYDSYGNLIGQSDETQSLPRFLYTGREWEGERGGGLYYYRRRYYDPQAGRFLSQDPIGFEGGDSNLYRYVGNDPVNQTDPTGLRATGSTGSLPGGLAGAGWVTNRGYEVGRMNFMTRWAYEWENPTARLREYDGVWYDTTARSPAPEIVRASQLSVAMDEARAGVLDYASASAYGFGQGAWQGTKASVRGARDNLVGLAGTVLDTANYNVINITDSRYRLYDPADGPSLSFYRSYEAAAGPNEDAERAGLLKRAGLNLVTFGVWDQAQAMAERSQGRISDEEFSYRVGGTGLLQSTGILSRDVGRASGGTTSSVLATPGSSVGMATQVRISANRTLALLPSKGGTGPLRWQVVSRAQRPHGNSLLAAGPHDVYAMVDRATGRVLHFGETGRGASIRGADWRRFFQRLGIQTDVVSLRTVQGKAAARALETRYISTYERVFGSKPQYNRTNH